MWNQDSFSGRRVLVTAGADGIGLAIARSFVSAGARVLVCDVQEAALSRLAADLPQVNGCRADVSSEAEVAALFEVLDQKLGGLDILVNNAGIAGPTGGVETLSLADWERTQRNCPVRLTASVRSQSARDKVSTPPVGPAMPALFTRMSRPPSFWSSTSNSAATSASLETSAR